MAVEKSLFHECANELIDFVLESEGHDLVYREFCSFEPRLKSSPFGIFCREYVPFKLALGCVYWVGCCAQYGIEDKEIKNLFFKGAMELFGSPKSLEEATRFSESLYASNADKEQSPVLGALVHFFHKLGLESMVNSDGNASGALNAGFHFMMQVAEALKVAFEAKFDEFSCGNENLRVAENRKKARK